MSDAEFIERKLTESIIGAFLTSYHKLGFGFLESIYSCALEVELIKRGHSVRREYAVEIWYDGIKLGAHRIDLLVDDRIALEIKATEGLARFRPSPLLTLG